LSAPLIRPFAGLRPRAEYAASVAAPPYDVLSSNEARERAAGKPYSFLYISRAEISLPDGTDPYSSEVYAKSAENFKKLIDQEVLCRDDKSCYYAYRLAMGEHVQTGLVVTASVAAYNTNRIRKHELTRLNKEDDRVRQIEALNAQTGPALLAHPDSDEAEKVIASATNQQPVIDFVADDGIQHTLWKIDETSAIDRIGTLFNAMPELYIADGHHRSAAASRVAATRKGVFLSDSADYFLAVIFPARQMRVMSYNRVASDLNGHTVKSFIAAVSACYDVTLASHPVCPEHVGIMGMYLDGCWHYLSIHHERIPQDDPVRCLDVSMLSELILSPILGITDLRRDARIDFVGGIRGLGELEKRVDSGEMAVAFSMFPTPMHALMSVADAGKVMPPKSTWFEPKLADGLVSHVLD